MNTKSTLKFIVAYVSVLVFSLSFSFGQVIRPYSLVYSTNMKGGHVMFGNTSMTIFSSQNVPDTAKANYFQNGTNGTTSIYGNDNSNMQYVDVDTVASTFNASSSDLILPSIGTNSIKYARLYWGARIKSGQAGDSSINLRTVKIMKGTTGNYFTAIAPFTQVDRTLVSGSDSVYQSYIDITSFVNSNGAGTYTVANVTAATGSVGSGGNYAGWCIAVAYENDSLPYSSIRMYDGFLQIYSGGNVTSQSIVLNGFNAPATPLVSTDAYMTTMAWEGDANLAASNANPLGDYLQINGTTVTNALNPSDNFWNGTISNNGVFVNTKNPNYKNQFGIDIDEQDVGVGYGIVSNSTQVSVEFGTEADQYFPGVFAFTIITKPPTVTIEKTVADSMQPYHVLQPGEALTYTMSGSNVGVGPAYNCVIVDSIPNNVTYIPGTLHIITSPDSTQIGLKTDASGDDIAFEGVNGSRYFVQFFIGTGATDSSGGVLQPGDSYSVSFKARAPSSVNQISTVVNTARITGNAFSGDPFVSDATAIIGPLGGPLPVNLSSFDAIKNENDVLLQWTTQSEVQNEQFEVEQSLDGIHFSTIGTVKGNGTTSLTNNYQFVDPINASDNVLYFRLAMKGPSQEDVFTKIVAVNISNLNKLKNLVVYPNPFVGNLTMQIQSDKNEKVVVELLDINGQVLSVRNIYLQSGQNIVELRDLNNIRKGALILQLINDTGIISQRIIRQ